MIVIEIPNYLCYKCYIPYESVIKNQIIIFTHPKFDILPECPDTAKQFERPITHFLVSVFHD